MFAACVILDMLAHYDNCLIFTKACWEVWLRKLQGTPSSVYGILKILWQLPALKFVLTLSFQKCGGCDDGANWRVLLHQSRIGSIQTVRWRPAPGGEKVTRESPDTFWWLLVQPDACRRDSLETACNDKTLLRYSAARRICQQLLATAENQRVARETVDGGDLC